MTDETTELNLFAGFWRQVWAGSLDIIIAMLSFTILFIIVFAILVNVSPADWPLDTLTAWFKLLSFSYYFLYRTLFISSKYRASYGMRALNIFVTDLSGERISFLRAAYRELLTYVSSIFYFGYLMIPFKEKEQGFHDILSKCLVLKKEPRLF